MKKLNHKLLGELEFEEEYCVWRKKDKFRLFNKDFEANIDILEYKEEIDEYVESEEYAEGIFQEEQVNALNFFYENKKDILLEVENKIFKYYKDNVKDFRSYETDDYKDKVAPFIKTKKELGKLIYDMGLFISDSKETGIRKLGITFECTWEESHGLGILLKNEKIIKVGTIDDAL